MGNRMAKMLLFKETTPGSIPSNPVCYAMSAEGYNINAPQDSETNTLIGKGRSVSKNTYGPTNISGDIPIIYTTDNALIFAVHGIGEVTTSAAATADSWAATTAYAKGDLVNHSDGLHTLVCYVAGTSGATEPDLSAYTTSAAGRGIQVTDGTVTWIIMPKLWSNAGVRGDCLKSFGIEVEDNDACAGGASEYNRKLGIYVNTIGLNMTGDTKGVKYSLGCVGTNEEDSILDASYTEMSAQVGFSEVTLEDDFYSYDDCTVEIDAEAATVIDSCDITITNNVTVKNKLNQSKEGNVGTPNISGNLNATFRSDWYQDAKNHTTKTLKFTYSKANGCQFIVQLQIEMAKVDKLFSTNENTMLNIPFSAFDTSTVESVQYSVIGPIQTY